MPFSRAIPLSLISLFASCVCVDTSKLTTFKCSEGEESCPAGLQCCADDVCRPSCTAAGGGAAGGNAAGGGTAGGAQAGGAAAGGSAAGGASGGGLSSDAGPGCTAESCPNGCCDGDRCVAGTSAMACGARGGACSTCPGSETCVNGACSGCAATCAGCCVGSTCTTPGRDACGPAGQSCAACGATADSCSSAGECSCGTGRACASGQRCSNGACVCDSSSCANGCCTANGQCVGPSGQNETLCGAGGQACAGCSAPQAAVCVNATTRRAGQVPGVCTAGACTYVDVQTTCPNGCNNGSCIGDLCQGCTTPPLAVCMGTSRRSYATPGVCGTTGCTYTPVDTACPFGCSGGACLPDPCTGVSCNAPPPSTCTGSVRTSYAAPGVCAMGSCSYTASTETCAFGCTAGACLGNPCTGVTCTTPPTATCMGSTRKGFVSPGTCSNGQCSYAPQDTVCSNGCLNGLCLGDACAGVTCTMPPPAQCANPMTRRTFAAMGTCAVGVCSYTPTDSPCPFGCNMTTAQCNPDPCATVTCTTAPATTCNSSNTARRVFTTPGMCSAGTCSYSFVDTACNSPPATTCFNATTRRSFASTGTCSSGMCSYAPTDTTCQFGCANNQCNADPCSTVSCNTPPPADCPSGTQRRTFQNPGSCSNGTCSYTPVVTTCNSPPQNTCSGSVAVQYPSTGACAGGACSYTPTNTTCQFGCSNGSCVGDPCATVSCTSPPAADCLNGTTRRTYNSTGTCSAGTCSYGTQTFSCNTPPAALCLNATTRRTFSAAGTCSGGACSYAPTDTPCTFGCNAASNQCNPDPCASVSCNSPPAADCFNSTTRRTYSAMGTCSGGTCSYAAQTFACDSPPPPTCSGNVLVTSAAAGTCAGGACSYGVTNTTCVNGCSAGACLPCVAGVACVGNPGAPCRTGVTACPGGPNSTAVCTNGVNASGDCGTFTTGGCSYADSCIGTGTLTGTQQTCSNGTCSGSRVVNQANHPSCVRNREGAVCETTGGCSGSNNCICIQQITNTCQSGVCQYFSEITLTCGTNCMQCAIQ
ncbi:MAG: hypothetical protein Q8N26_25535 [Myxococcales bacterium]|nr:hypothetical protein [Myxococcales bacterium]